MTQKSAYQVVARESVDGILIGYSKDIYLQESEAIRHRVRWYEDLVEKYPNASVYLLKVEVHIP